MKYLLVFLALFASQVFAFQPNDLISADIKRVEPCKGMICALVEKNGEQYLIMGQPIDEENLGIVAIYKVERKKIRLIWSILWTET